MKKLLKPEIKTVVNDDLAEGIYMLNSGWEVVSPFYATQGPGNIDDYNVAVGCTYGHPRSQGVTDGNTHGPEAMAVYQGLLEYHGKYRRNALVRIDLLIEQPLNDPATGQTLVNEISISGNFGQLTMVDRPAVVGNRVITYWRGNLQNGDTMGFDAFNIYFNRLSNPGECFNTLSDDPVVHIESWDE